MISTRPIGIALLAASLLGLGAASASAQGTPEQREACTPDALRICADTIPDVGRTAACMRAHRGELSPRCQAVFDGTPRAEAPTRVAVMRPKAMRPKTKQRPRMVDRPRRERVVVAVVPAHRHHAALRGDRDTRKARRVIGRLCGLNFLNADTCGFMGRVLTLAE